MLADIDTIAVKLAEFVNKRSRDESTNHCPVIPTIFFTHDGVDETDLLDSLITVGGATKILKASCPTKDVLYTIIEVLYKCKLVENTYKELNARKTLVSKYPYYPLFQSANDKSATSHSHKQTRKDKETRDKDTDEVSAGDSSELSLRERLEDRDDWTHSSSLLPKFVKDLRKNVPEKVKVQKSNAENEASRERVNTSGKSPGEDRERATIPAIEMRSNASLSSASQSSSSIIDSERVVVDPLNFQYLDNDAIDDLVENSLGGQGSSVVEKSLQLLHPSTRPTCSMLQPRRSASIHSSSTDIYPFFNKPMPELSAQLTVGGLDKRFVTPCWDILHSQLFLKEKEKEKKTAKSVIGSPVKSSFDSKIPLHETVTLTPSKNDYNNSHNISRGKSGSRKVSFSDSHGRSGEHVDDSDVASKSTMNTMESSVGVKLMDKSKRQMSGLSAIPVSKGTNMGVLLDIQAAKAEKKIMALTNEVAPDILFTRLVEIDFNNRKINTGELDILQKGMKLEEKGDTNAAITCYTRAGKLVIHGCICVI